MFKRAELKKILYILGNFKMQVYGMTQNFIYLFIFFGTVLPKKKKSVL